MAAARSMGFNDLAAPALDLPEASQQPAAAAAVAAGAGASGNKKKAKKAAKEAAAAAANADAALSGDGATAVAAAAFGATCQSALGELEHLERVQQGAVGPDQGGAGPGAEAAAGLGGKYAGQLPRLTRRFPSVARGALPEEDGAVGPVAGGQAHPNDGCTAVAGYALATAS